MLICKVVITYFFELYTNRVTINDNTYSKRAYIDTVHKYDDKH